MIRLFLMPVCGLALAFLLVDGSSGSRVAVAHHEHPCPDLNGDGWVTTEDIDISWSYFGLDPPTTAPVAVDLNNSGHIELSDAASMEPILGNSSTCQDTPVGGYQGPDLTFNVLGTGNGTPAAVTVKFPKASGDFADSNSQSFSGNGTAMASTFVVAINTIAANNGISSGLAATSVGNAVTVTFDQMNAGAVGGFIVGVAGLCPALTLTVPSCTFNPTINIPGGDDDGDGCDNTREYGPNHVSGGLRSPNYFWDFFDLNGDLAIDLSDTIDVLGYFGDSGTSPAGNLRDRNTGPFGFWATVEANDGVDLNDAIVSLQSFGDSC